MRASAHVPARLSATDALGRIRDLDWPGALSARPDKMESELVWVPFDPASGRAAIEPGSPVDLSALRVAFDRVSPVEGAPTGEGRVLFAKDEREVFHHPFWILREGESAQGWVAVDAVSGELSVGDLTAAKGAAYLRLAFLVGVLLLSVVLGGLLVLAVVAPTVSLARLVSEPFAWSVAVLVTGIVVSGVGFAFLHPRGPNLAAVVPSPMREPAARCATGRILLPLDRSWLRMLTAAGILLLLTLPLQLVALVGAAAGGQVGAAVFMAVALVLCSLLSVDAIRVARGAWLPKGPARAPLCPALIPSEPVEELLRTAVGVTAISTAGMVVAAALGLAGSLDAVVGPASKDLPLLLGYGIETGALLGVLLTKIPWRARAPLLVGMLAATALQLASLPWVFVTASLVGVAISAWPGAYRTSGATARSAAWAALRLSWGLHIVAAVGRVLGRVAGGFLLGVPGATIGAVLGERIGAALGLFSQMDYGPHGNEAKTEAVSS